MGEELTTKSKCVVYCFNHGSGGSRIPGCGLRDVSEDWQKAIGTHREERMIVCVMTEAHEAFSRTKWDWFTCDRSLFPGGQKSPWGRSISCDVTLLDRDGQHIASDSIALTEGFGISAYSLDDNPNIMIAPVWVDTANSSWQAQRYCYVPTFTFPRYIELTANEAASLSEVQCAVRPFMANGE
jgi:hypothetical protein